MNFEWFKKQNGFTKIAMQAAGANILFTLFIFLFGQFVPEHSWFVLPSLGATLINFLTVLLIFAGIVGGIIGIAKDLKERKKPNIIAVLVLAINLLLLANFIFAGIPRIIYDRYVPHSHAF
ncbi:MAG: hypothetical protein NT067_04060 [Candidatus Diapherotrites archaeon]|nr:hypothetical protein [Candidatus Diapherotrites archaeon]